MGYKKPSDLETNPIYQRLTRNSGWPDDQAIRWLIVGVVGIGLLCVLAVRSMASPWLGWPVLWLIGASIAITPAVASLVAVSIVTHDLQKEDFQLVRLTLATDNSLFHGYTYATTHRLRVLLISTRSLIPSFIALGVVLQLPGYPRPLSSIILTAIIVLVGTLPLVTATRQFSEMGAALGVTLALWWQRPIPAAIGASMIMLIVSPVLLGACAAVLAVLITCGVMGGEFLIDLIRSHSAQMPL